MIPQQSSVYRYQLQVPASGELSIPVSLPAGSRVMILVVPEKEDDFNDLVQAANRSLDFWDNPYDDEDWNDA